MTAFEKIRNYINTKEVSNILSRKEIMAQEFGWCVSIDEYRLWFTNAGYLKWMSRGKYEVVKKIPINMTSRKLRKEAYPNTWMNWYENCKHKI
jgi:hypothetical protein